MDKVGVSKLGALINAVMPHIGAHIHTPLMASGIASPPYAGYFRRKRQEHNRHSQQERSNRRKAKRKAKARRCNQRG